MFKVRDKAGKAYGVKFYHNIAKREENKPSTSVCTILELGESKETNRMIGQGISILGQGDQYNRKVARKLTFGRALKDAGFDRSTRRGMWLDYFMAHESEVLPPLSQFDKD